MTTDSLNLLAYQAGLVATPLEEQAASAARDLCTDQELMRIGDPLPLVFCRRQGDLGGVLVSPPATEARFENNATNVLTASWHLVVSEGPIDPIEVRDVFQCACRVGTSSQAFSKRAGAWTPGNVTVDRGGNYTRWDVPRFCGAPGTYDELHTLSFVNTYDDGEEWNRQIHLFLRGGRHVQRLIDNVTGPSCNVVDLYLLLLRKVERIPENLIDLDSLRHAARFTETLGLRFDGRFSGDATQNLDDWCENVLKPYFLLARTRVNGREGLMPLLPTNLDGSIYTGVVGPHATLTELDLDLSTWDLQFLSLTDRRPICAQMMWRQQGDGIDSIIRTTEVRFKPPYNAPDGPFEQHDLSEFACSERHVAKVGAYAVAHRALVHHTLKVSAIPGDYNRTIGDGYIVRVKVPRQSSSHDYLYRVVSIEKDLGGETVFNLVHFPLDAEGRSAVAMAVVSAQPSGLLLPITKTGPVCDVNSSTDTSDLPDDSIPWDLPDNGMFDIPIEPPLDGPDGPAIDPPPPFVPPPPFDPPGPPVDPPGPPVDPPGPPVDPPPPPPPGPGQQMPVVPPGCTLHFIEITNASGEKQTEYIVECPPPNQDQPNPDKQPPAPPPGVPGQPGPGPSPGSPWGPLGPPAPGMPSYDIFWEQANDRYSTAFYFGDGRLYREAETYSAGDNYMQMYALNVTSWVFVQVLSQKFSYGPTFSSSPAPLPLGITGFNSNETSPNGYFGFTRIGGPAYQGGGQATGPTFETGTHVHFCRIKNFRIRKHGTDDPPQLADPGKGQDGDTLLG